jgi:enoyl-CoA hydratase
MSYETLLFDVEGPIGILTFNRPDKLNAMSSQVLAEFAAVLDRVKGDPEIRVLLLTGSGRAFMAGADIKEFLRLDALGAREFAQKTHEVFLQIGQLEVPVIACVNGFALGGGMELSMSCDFIYASEEAKFGQPEINLGIIPGWGGTQRLPRLVGKGTAKELCMTGRMITAEEALRIGLVARVFPAATLMEECRKVAGALAAKGRVALRSAKQVIDRGFDVDLRTGCSLEIDAWALCFASPDAKEGATAFLEKRPPKFL